MDKIVYQSEHYSPFPGVESESCINPNATPSTNPNGTVNPVSDKDKGSVESVKEHVK